MLYETQKISRTQTFPRGEGIVLEESYEFEEFVDLEELDDLELLDESQDFVIARGQTLTESMGMVHDAAHERARRRAAAQEIAQRRAERRDLSRLRAQAQARRRSEGRLRRLLKWGCVAAVSLVILVIWSTLAFGDDDSRRGSAWASSPAIHEGSKVGLW